MCVGETLGRELFCPTAWFLEPLLLCAASLGLGDTSVGGRWGPPASAGGAWLGGWSLCPRAPRPPLAELTPSPEAPDHPLSLGPSSLFSGENRGCWAHRMRHPHPEPTAFLLEKYIFVGEQWGLEPRWRQAPGSSAQKVSWRPLSWGAIDRISPKSLWNPVSSLVVGSFPIWRGGSCRANVSVSCVVFSPSDRRCQGTNGYSVLCPQSPQLLSPTPTEVTARPQPAPSLLMMPPPGL